MTGDREHYYIIPTRCMHCEVPLAVRRRHFYGPSAIGGLDDLEFIHAGGGRQCPMPTEATPSYPVRIREELKKSKQQAIERWLVEKGES